MKNLLVFILIFSFLTSLKAEVSELDQALFKAIKNDNIESFKELIENGANPNAKNENENSLLHLSIEKEERDFFDILIKSNVDVNVQGAQKDSPLHWAVLETQTYYTKVLIKKGANPNAVNEAGRTPLHFASSFGENSLLQMKLLLEAEPKADVNAKDNKGQSPLYISLIEPEPDKVRFLIKHGADVNLSNKLGISPLHKISSFKSARKGTTRLLSVIIDDLVKNGADVNATDNFGHTPLMEAVKSNPTITQKLILHNANIFAVDSAGRSVKDRVVGFSKLEDEIRKVLTKELNRRNQMNRAKASNKPSSLGAKPRVKK